MADSKQRLRLIAVLALVLAPHTLRVPPWVALLVGAVLAWQALAALRGWPQPGRILRFLLVVVVVAGVYASFGRIDGHAAGVSLLSLMLALKLTETTRHRDVVVLLALAYFVLITHFLFSQALVMIGFMALATWLITACLVDANHPQGALPARAALKTSGVLLAQALPVAALLFVLFPRIPGPLWGLPADAGATAVSGLSDSMRFGSVARVALSDAVAFRVRFEGRPPPPAQRYWRGPVFWRFDGERWTVGRPQRYLHHPPHRVLNGAPLRYRLTLEPHGEDWVLALDLPANAPGDTFIDAAGSLRSAEPITQRRAFDLVSYPRHRLGADAPAALLDYARRLPSSGNPRTRALARRWRAQGLGPAEMVAKALTRFNRLPYHYTLQPQPLLGANRIDSFLFDSQEGFCEHYAGAFTFLMRAAGLPARVVTGYQGGSPSLGDYLIVRGADAHAWSEVWLSGRGWLRVDPTAAVAPARIERGLAAALPAGEPIPFLARGAGNLWYRLQLGWDWVNAGWNRWFLAYGPRLQGDFLGRLGLPDARSMVLALTVLGVALLTALGALLAWQARPQRSRDPVQAAWLRLGRRLARHGLARAASEGPLDYAERVARARPGQAAELRRLARWYAQLRYAGNADPERGRQFVAAARAFRAKPATTTAAGKRGPREPASI